MNQTQVLQFTQQLATLLGAGQPLDRALQILLELPESEKARRIIERIRDHVRGGAPLSEALEAEPGVFSRLYVNMVRAGEIGGSLDATLARLANYLERAKALKESVINAMIYPAILVVMVFAALFVLLVFVVPQFLPMFKDMNVELPMITKIVLFVGTTLQRFLVADRIGVVFAVMLCAASGSPIRRSRLAWDARVLTMRVVGPLIAQAGNRASGAHAGNFAQEWRSITDRARHRAQRARQLGAGRGGGQGGRGSEDRRRSGVRAGAEQALSETGDCR